MLREPDIFVAYNCSHYGKSIKINQRSDKCGHVTLLTCLRPIKGKEKRKNNVRIVTRCVDEVRYRATTAVGAEARSESNGSRGTRRTLWPRHSGRTHGPIASPFAS